jgi:hypothetical protein
MSHKEERREIAAADRIAESLERIERLLCEFLFPALTIPTSIQMTQGGITMSFKILPGATGIFGLTLSPAGSAFPLAAVITWTGDGALSDVSDPVPSLATATQPAGLTAAVTSSTAPVATSENLTCTAVFTDPVSGNTITLTTGPNAVALGSGVASGAPVPTSISMTQLS